MPFTDTTDFSIGIVPAKYEAAGGIYQYSQRMLDVLWELMPKRLERVVVLGNGLGRKAPLLQGHDWEVHPLIPGRMRRVLLDPFLRITQEHLNYASRDRVIRIILSLRRRGRRSPSPMRQTATRNDVQQWLKQLGLHLILYPAPSAIAFEAGLPYVMAIHDLQHRINPQFPEISSGGQAEKREYLFRNGIARATLILTDSEVGREDVLTYYGDLIDPERVAVLPFLPSPAVDYGVAPKTAASVHQKYRLPKDYLFYPAQFWPHKNHIAIVEALGRLRRQHGDIPPLVLTGSAAGPIRRSTFRHLMTRARELGVSGAISYLGYVPDPELAPLYSGAAALVMPTYFGPTNLPILEAWSLGCPVITSDIRGVREQVGDAAILADPDSPDELADAIHRVWLDRSLRNELVVRGRRRLCSWTRSDYAARLSEILDHARSIVESGEVCTLAERSRFTSRRSHP